MKYYTKEWYHLMNSLNLAVDMQAVPDKEYTDAEIKEFYDQDMAAHVENNTRFFALMKQSFDLADLVKSFEDAYKEKCLHGLDRYPAWVRETVDRRLAALGRLPESVFRRLEAEDDANREKFRLINDTAREILDEQDIPDEAQFDFWMFESDVLKLEKVGEDAELYLRKGDGPVETALHVKVHFSQAEVIEQEEGLFGEGCKYLYEEVYRMEDGYEVHMMLGTSEGPAYLTIRCRDIWFEECTC